MFFEILVTMLFISKLNLRFSSIVTPKKSTEERRSMGTPYNSRFGNPQEILKSSGKSFAKDYFLKINEERKNLFQAEFSLLLFQTIIKNSSLVCK